jgi:hypothetical protein
MCRQDAQNPPGGDVENPASPGEVSDGCWKIYSAQKEAFDAITKIPDILHIILDTSLMPEESTYKALQKIRNFNVAVI